LLLTIFVLRLLLLHPGLFVFDALLSGFAFAGGAPPHGGNARLLLLRPQPGAQVGGGGGECSTGADTVFKARFFNALRTANGLLQGWIGCRFSWSALCEQRNGLRGIAIQLTALCSSVCSSLLSALEPLQSRSQSPQSRSQSPQSQSQSWRGVDGAALEAATALAGELVASLKMLAEEQTPLLTRADWERLVSALDASFTSVQAALCAIAAIEAPRSSAAAAAREACTTTLSTVVEVRISLHLRVSTTDPSHWAKLNTQLYPALNSAAVAAVWGWGRAVDHATRVLIEATESESSGDAAHQAYRHEDEESAPGSAGGGSSNRAGAQDACEEGEGEPRKGSAQVRCSFLFFCLLSSLVLCASILLFCPSILLFAHLSFVHTSSTRLRRSIASSISSPAEAPRCTRASPWPRRTRRRCRCVRYMSRLSSAVLPRRPSLAPPHD
jgi:hypothetical protein